MAGQEEERGGPGRRCGTSSKGARSALSPWPPGGRRVGQAPGAACPRPKWHPGSTWAQSSLTGQRRVRRRELGLCSTPLRAAQDGPEGREKPPGRLGWTSEFRGQPSPPEGRARERCSRGPRWGRPGLCGGPVARGGGVGWVQRTGTFVLFKLAGVGERRPGWRQRPWRARPLGWVARVAAFCSDARGPGGEAGSHALTLARARQSRGAATPTARGLGSKGRDGLSHAPGSSPQGRRSSTHPRSPGPRPRRPAHTHPWRGASAHPRAQDNPGVSGNREKEHKAKEGAKRRRRRAGARVLRTRLEVALGGH